MESDFSSPRPSMTLDQIKRVQRLLDEAPRADFRAVILPWYREPLVVLWIFFAVLSGIIGVL